MSKLLQVFLSDDASNVSVSEVSIDTDTDRLTCTCPGFKGRNTCKHAREVEARIRAFGGVYPMEFTDRVDEEELVAAISGGEDMLRQFVLKYGKVDVL